MLRGIPRSLDYGPHEHSCVLALVSDMAEKNGSAERKDARHSTRKHAKSLLCRASWRMRFLARPTEGILLELR